MWGRMFHVGPCGSICGCGAGGPICVDVGQGVPCRSMWVRRPHVAACGLMWVRSSLCVAVGQEAPCGSMWVRRPHV